MTAPKGSSPTAPQPGKQSGVVTTTGPINSLVSIRLKHGNKLGSGSTQEIQITIQEQRGLS